MSDDQQELLKWMGEFDYNRQFFADLKGGQLIAVLSQERWNGQPQEIRDHLLAYREHAQELLAAIVALEKIVG